MSTEAIAVGVEDGEKVCICASWLSLHVERFGTASNFIQLTSLIWQPFQKAGNNKQNDKKHVSDNREKSPAVIHIRRLVIIMLS